MDKLKKYGQLLLPISLGIGAFILVTGGKILWPTNINWLFLHGDMTDGLFAWQYFRYTPIFQNPLGANFPYGMGMGGSIIYAEPLFLFAFPFKLISNLISTHMKHPNLVVDITVNHSYIGKLSYDIKNLGIRRIEIPYSAIGTNNFLEVQFAFRNATSPFKLKLSSDIRILGLFISSLTFDSKNNL